MNIKTFSGARLFYLKATHGIPLGPAIDRIINTEGLAITWYDFLASARNNGWYDFQTIEAVESGLSDAGVDRAMRDEILQRFKVLIMRNPIEYDNGTPAVRSGGHRSNV
ncbi:hypothetical protein [Pseudomonas rustica]